MTGEWVTMSGEARSKPSAEPVLTVDTREELVYLLGQACEIEHGLMCEYLYAQFSLKRGLDEGLSPAQLARVQAWEMALIAVIKQEMLHLALATNILTAIGAAPHFEACRIKCAGGGVTFGRLRRVVRRLELRDQRPHVLTQLYLSKEDADRAVRVDEEVRTLSAGPADAAALGSLCLHGHAKTPSHAVPKPREEAVRGFARRRHLVAGHPL